MDAAPAPWSDPPWPRWTGAGRVAAPGFAAFRTNRRRWPAARSAGKGFLHLSSSGAAATRCSPASTGAPAMAQRALCRSGLPDMAWLFTITTSGCVLRGDRLALEIAARPRRARARDDAGGDQDPQRWTPTTPRRRSRSRSPTALSQFLRAADPAPARRSCRRHADRGRAGATLFTARSCSRGRKRHHPDEAFGATLLLARRRGRRL